MRAGRVVALTLVCVIAAVGARADDIVDQALAAHILPGFATLETRTAALAATCPDVCAPGDGTVRTAFHDAFDAWIGVAHLRFGPTETDERGFALAFWPDSRGATQKALSRLLKTADPATLERSAFSRQSVAARGLYALERLLYDDMLPGEDAYRARLIAAVTRDIATTAAAIADDWQTRYATVMRTAGDPSNETYLSAEEARRELFTALITGLETTEAPRLVRPLGSFDRPRPTRAEARRSGRSLRHIQRSLEALQSLARLLAAEASAETRASLDAAFERARQDAAALDDPTLAGVAEPASRIRIEALQLRVREIRKVVALDLGPALGVSAGFNALDGD